MPFDILTFKRKFRTRDTIFYMGFSGFAVAAMTRAVLNMTIISMINRKPNQITVNLTNVCFDDATLPNISTGVSEDFAHKLNWDQNEQGNILGSFYWLFWLVHLSGALMSVKFGPKKVIGWAVFLEVLCCILTPTAAFMGSRWLISLRVLQGIAGGHEWAPMINLYSRWSPPNERGTFAAMFMGGSVGSALTYAITGFIMQNWGWVPAYYVYGGIGILWSIAWSFLVYDGPSLHPRISKEEKRYILESIGCSLSPEKQEIPWKKIFTSAPVWTIHIASLCSAITFYTILIYIPSYLNFIHGWNFEMTGALSALGHASRSTMAFVFGYFSDYLLKTRKLSRTNIRKLLSSGYTIGSGFFMLAIGISGCNQAAVPIFLTLAMVAFGSFVSGSDACLVDMSPNYCFVLSGLVSTTYAASGFISPLIIDYFTHNNLNVHQWQKVFFTSSFLAIFGGVQNLVFINAEVQSWNGPIKVADEREVMAPSH